MKNVMKLVCMPILVAGLAACGGGEGGLPTPTTPDPTTPDPVTPDPTTPDPTTPDPITPDPTTPDPGDQKIPPASGAVYLQFAQTKGDPSDLGGLAIRTNTSVNETKPVELTGSFDHSNAALVLINGTYEFRAMGGETAGGEYVDDAKKGTVILLNTDTVRTDGFAHFMDMDAVQDEVSYSTLGVVGIPTLAADMPSKGSASYTGRVLGTAATTTQGFDIVDGSSLIAVDFGTSGTVNVTLNNFKFQDQSTGADGTGPFDKLVVTGMTLSDAEFSGGTIALTKSGASVDLTGTNTATASNGMLFGYDDDTGHPVQAGGILMMQGDSGFLNATYLGK